MGKKGTGEKKSREGKTIYWRCRCKFNDNRYLNLFNFKIINLRYFQFLQKNLNLRPILDGNYWFWANTELLPREEIIKT